MATYKALSKEVPGKLKPEGPGTNPVEIKGKSIPGGEDGLRLKLSWCLQNKREDQCALTLMRVVKREA